MRKSMGFDTVAGLLLICVFAVCLFFALAAGAGIYKSISAVMEEQFTSRTACGYVASRLRQGDAEGAVSVGSLGEEEALIISEEIDGEAYRTYVYCHDGYIRELFCPASEELTPTDGLRVIPAESLSFSVSGGLLRFVCVTSAGSETLFYFMKAGAGA